jgi:Dynein light chain type 1
MSTEMSQEILELVTMAVDKFINVKNYEVAACCNASLYASQKKIAYRCLLAKSKASDSKLKCSIVTNHKTLVPSCILLLLSQAAAQLIKHSLDKKFGASWHCAIGEGFGFEITYQQRNMIYVYYGQLGVLAYKC